ncbi:MAG: flagellin [Armatimonadota bacterium]
MSFRINTNVGALSAFNSVNQVSDMLGKSQGKLSSGLRIKDASDDPAGLISSELFRSQINSMDAALRNNQEALNYAKTAENALGEMSKLLSDARGLAIASGNSATLTAAQVAANQDQINSIISSIDRISTTVTYSGRKLLDGSAGTTTQISNQTKIAGFSFGGSLGTTSITSNGLITLAQTTAATRALYTATSLLTTGALQSGTVALNGVNFNISAGTTGASLANVFNAASAQTGVTASWNAAGNQLTFQSVQTGSNRQITFTDTTGVVSSAANTTANTTGVDAAATVTIGGIAALFTGGRSGADGLTLSDQNGNKLQIGEGGNAVSAAAAVGRVMAADSSFQIGFLAGVTANLALRNMGSSQLGTGIVSGTTMNNLDVSTAQNATNALAVIDKAIEEVSSMRGKIGNFQRNVLETNSRSLTSMRENLSASESSIRDLDIAQEMTNYTKLQVMEQAGMAILGQANQSGQGVLSLLRG